MTSPLFGKGMGASVAVFVSAVLIGSLMGAAFASGGDDRPSIGGWPEDANGDGIISDSGEERIPELIKAVGDKGVDGYVRFEDLGGPQPSSPEEAVRISGEERVIPVYAEDGETVIDTYTLRADPAPDERPQDLSSAEGSR